MPSAFFFRTAATRVFRSFDQVAALAAQRPSRRRADQARARRPDARAADFTEIGSISLGQSPFVIVLRDVGTSGDAEMKVNLAHEIEQVAVAVDQARKNRFAFHVDDTGIPGARRLRRVCRRL